MGSSNSIVFLTTLVVLLLSFFTPAYSTKSTTNDLIQTTCTHTPDPATCEATLRADPKSATADEQGLTLIMISVVKTKYTNAEKVASDLAHGSTDPGVTKALNDCVEKLNVVVDYNVPAAVSAVEGGQPKYGVDAMVDSSNEAGWCLTGFPSGKTPAQLVGQLPDCRGVADIAAALIRLMQ